MMFRRSKDRVLQTEVDGGIALLDPVTNTYFLLNRTGAIVWSTLQKESTLDDVCAEVANQFDVTTERCKDDVMRLIDSMAQRGFVVTKDAEST